jgi:hypothetical protein
MCVAFYARPQEGVLRHKNSTTATQGATMSMPVHFSPLHAGTFFINAASRAMLHCCKETINGSIIH